MVLTGHDDLREQETNSGPELRYLNLDQPRHHKKSEGNSVEFRWTCHSQARNQWTADSQIQQSQWARQPKQQEGWELECPRDLRKRAVQLYRGRLGR